MSSPGTKNDRLIREGLFDKPTGNTRKLGVQTVVRKLHMDQTDGNTFDVNIWPSASDLISVAAEESILPPSADPKESESKEYWIRKKHAVEEEMKVLQQQLDAKRKRLMEIQSHLGEDTTQQAISLPPENVIPEISEISPSVNDVDMADNDSSALEAKSPRKMDSPGKVSSPIRIGKKKSQSPVTARRPRTRSMDKKRLSQSPVSKRRSKSNAPKKSSSPITKPTAVIDLSSPKKKTSQLTDLASRKTSSPRKTTPAKVRTRRKKRIITSSDDESDEVEEKKQEQPKEKPKQKTKSKPTKSPKKVSKKKAGELLPLDKENHGFIIHPPFTEESVRTWSEARLTCWRQRHTNANAFYYRFVDIGPIQQGAGAFTKEEHIAFIKRMKEFDDNGWKLGKDWGLFSKALPGRCGYHCSNYYRKLVKAGLYKDDTYNVQADGSIKKKTRKGSKGQPTRLVNELNPIWKELEEVDRKIDSWVVKHHGTTKSTSKGTTKRKRTSTSTKKKQPAKPKKNTPQKDEESDAETPPRRKRKKRKREVTFFKMNNSSMQDMSDIVDVDDPIEDTEDDPSYIPQQEKKKTKRQKKRQSLRISTEPADIQQTHENDDDPMEEKDCTKKNNEDTVGFWSNLLSDASYNVVKGRTFGGHSRPKRAGTKKQGDRSEPYEYLAVPATLPKSWAHVIQPYSKDCGKQLLDEGKCTYEEHTMDSFALKLKKYRGKKYQGILMDPPWKLHADDDGVTPEDMVDWKIGNRLIPRGFLFIWVDKQYISEVIQMAAHWKFLYVENLVWIPKTIGNEIHATDAQYTKRSKLTLLILRKKTRASDMELRHQRNPDVVFDFFHDEKLREKPLFVYHMIETLLPTARYNKDTDESALLHLWAPKDHYKLGWDAVHFTHAH